MTKISGMLKVKKTTKKHHHIFTYIFWEADIFYHYYRSDYWLITKRLGNLGNFFFLNVFNAKLIYNLIFSFCLGVNECLNPQVHKCAQLCTDTLTGYYCSCNPGYRLMPDGKACDDLNECISTPSVCSQICENTVGSFHCKCAPGYIREPDRRTCRQNSGIPSYILYANRYYIRYTYVDGTKSGIALQGLSNVIAVDYDDYDKWLYWLDVGAGKIERMRFDGTSRETLVDHNIGGAEGLVVDWVGRWVKRKQC